MDAHPCSAFPPQAKGLHVELPNADEHAFSVRPGPPPVPGVSLRDNPRLLPITASPCRTGGSRRAGSVTQMLPANMPANVADNPHDNVAKRLAEGLAASLANRLPGSILQTSADSRNPGPPHPFTAPPKISAFKNRCAIANRIRIGASDSTAPAYAARVLASNWLIMLLSATGSVNVS